jgi:hypothetical protein
MVTAALEDRVTSLERRMSELEGQVGFLIPTLRQVHLDLLGFKEQVEQRFEKVDRRFDAMDRRLDAMDGKVDGLDAKVDGVAVEVGRLGAQVQRLDAKVDAMPRAVAEIVSGLIKK